MIAAKDSITLPKDEEIIWDESVGDEPKVDLTEISEYSQYCVVDLTEIFLGFAMPNTRRFLSSPNSLQCATTKGPMGR
jgi:hypothetical protein